MPVLHLGIVDQPYSGPSNEAKTTADVAKILEDKYGVMRAFFTLHEQDIANALAESVTDALESLLMGAPADINAFGAATSEIDTMFKRFLSDREIENMGIAGVPTGAALKGVSHRLKRPYVKANPRRPSLIDTGLYQNSFKSWID